MEKNSPEVTAPADTQNAITDRYEVETNVVSEPVKVEPETKVETETKPDSEPEPAEEPQESKTINPRTAARKAEKERLLREAAEAKAETARVKAELEQLKQPKPEGKQPKDLSKEPNIQDYEDAVEYTRDLARYDRKQEALQENQQKKFDAYNEKLESVIAEKPDFEEKVGALVDSGLITPEIEDAVLSSSMGPALSYHLAEYGGDLMALRGLPKELLPKAIKEIEAFIKKGGNPPEKPRVTQAPPPITPPSGMARTDRSASSYTQEEIENMPISEYNRIFVKK